MAFLFVAIIIFLVLSAIFNAVVYTMDETLGPDTTDGILATPLIIGAILILAAIFG